MTWRTVVRTGLGIVFALVLLPSHASTAPRTLPAPETYFGHVPGADRTLIGYDELVAYFQVLAQGSDRLELLHLGKTTEGRDFVMLAISTPENLARAAHYRDIAARLDDPRGRSSAEIDHLVAEGKVILLVTLNIHSDEIAVSQMSPEWVYSLVTGGNDSPARFLKDVIVLLVPSLNPDGQLLIADWYRSHLGTPYEGSEFPRLYHRYAGHDDNRDWFMLNLAETRLMNQVLYNEWHLQVVVDEHQMGRTGPRIFVPPYADPVTETVHPLIHRGTLLLGAEMAMALEASGKAGVIYGYAFDAYWPGGMRSTPWWKNTIGILTETASARLMTPVYVKPDELQGGGKGLSEYRAQVNFPHPWPGGWWRPRDIVEYALVVTQSALQSCSIHREDLLRNRAAMAQAAVHRGETEAPYAFLIPPDQHDPGAANRLVRLLLEHGVEVQRAPTDTRSGEVTVPAGSYVILTAQPYRPFIMEMMETQTYPEVKSGTDILAPYDVTAWTLPYLMGVTSRRVDAPITGRLEPAHVPTRVWDQHGPATWALSPRENDAYAAVARLLRHGLAVRQLTTAAAGNDGSRLEPGTFLTQAPPEAMRDALEGLDLQLLRREPPDAPVSDHPRERALRLPRIGLYEAWFPSSDEGWTRFVLDGFGFPYTLLHNQDIRSGKLRDQFDAILLPDASRRELMDGRDPSSSEDSSSSVPPEFRGGLGKDGRDALRQFLREGGTVIALGSAGSFAIHDLRASCRDAAETMRGGTLSTPGTLVRVRVEAGHPLGYGMPEEAIVFRTQDPVLTFPGRNKPKGKVIARYLEEPRVVASGWARGADALYGKGALVETPSGKGTIVLFGFRPQYRGQTHGTYRLLLNALLDSAVD